MRALIARRLSIIGFVLAGLLLVVVAAVAYQRLQELKSASRQVEHTLSVETELARTLSLVTDAESGQRGYLITGFAPYLEPYESAVAGLPLQLERLRQLTSDNAAQQERLRLLEGQVRRKLAELEATIIARKVGDTAAAGQIVAGGEGRQAMARIREVIDEMRAEEGRLLAERTAVQSRSLRIAIGVMLGGFLLALGLITSAVVLLNRVDRERDREAAARAMAEQIAAATAVSEERLRVTLQSIGDGVVTTDDRGRVTMLNGVAQALTDWTEREARGRQIEDVLVLVNQHTRAPAESPVGRVLREGVIAGLANHTILVSRQGREIPIDDSGAPIKDADGRIVGVVMVFRDVTERKRAEQALETAYQEARQRQREAESLATISRTINTLDRDAVLRDVAESACALLRADIAAVFGLEARSGDLKLLARGGPRGADLDPDASVPKGTGLVWLAAERREAVASPNVLEDPRIVHSPRMRARIEAVPYRAGLAVPLMVQTRLIGALFVGALPGRTFSATEIQLLTTLSDQAAVAMANAELYQDLQRANRIKDEFLATFGHELRNPLGAIAGASAVLKAARAQGPAADRARAVIDRQVHHLARLVDDLLDVGRLTTGKVSLNRQPLDLGDLAAGALDAWRAAGRFPQHQVVLERSSAWADIDETRIEQVIDNLIGNALKYTPAGGLVTVRVREEDGAAVLEVCDTGAGLPAELGERIFDLFVQGERPSDRAQGGLGIGLTLVRALVALHGGTVSARSDGPGQGSTFTVRLPRVSARATAPAVTRLGPATSTPRRILIVEDNDDAREMLRIQLTQEGHEVHEARDGVTGVDMAAAVGPEVVVVDVGLPGLDGYEVARRIRAGAGGRSMLLIALTGYGQAEDRSRARDAGFSLHLTKPVSPERLNAAIAEAPIS